MGSEMCIRDRLENSEPPNLENPNKLEKNFFQNQNILEKKFAYKKNSKKSKNISDVIRKAGGITSLSDLKRVEIGVAILTIY